MAKMPTEVEDSIVVRVPIARAYKFFWDVVKSADCIDGIDRCERVGKDIYRFRYKERSKGPVTMTVQYTARYKGNGKDQITFEGGDAEGDNTEVRGSIHLESLGASETRITLKQMLAPDTPVPRLMQGLLRSFVEQEAAAGLKQYLSNAKRAVEKKV